MIPHAVEFEWEPAIVPFFLQQFIHVLDIAGIKLEMIIDGFLGNAFKLGDVKFSPFKCFHGTDYIMGW